MREALGQMQVHFTQEEVLDAVTNPDRPLVGYQASFVQLRSKLSQHISACCTDEDLLRAARNTDQPLLASRACKIQVLARTKYHDEEVSLLAPPILVGELKSTCVTAIGRILASS